MIKKYINISYILYFCIFSTSLFFIYPSIYEFVSVITSRISLPYDIEWEEGMMLTSAYVLKTTGNLYPPPSFDFIPSLYAPIYFYILKFSFLFENYYLIARLLSLF